MKDSSPNQSIKILKYSDTATTQPLYSTKVDGEEIVFSPADIVSGVKNKKGKRVSVKNLKWKPKGLSFIVNKWKPKGKSKSKKG